MLSEEDRKLIEKMATGWFLLKVWDRLASFVVSALVWGVGLVVIGVLLFVAIYSAMHGN